MSAIAAAHFSATASTVAQDVIGSYSTSFGWATQLLGARHRNHVRNIYALVRVADEIVDGAAAGFALDTATQEQLLNDYEQRTEKALAEGFSTDLVIHAFATTAAESGFGSELTAPFFQSMRADLCGSPATPQERADYIYGSAEVVGLMCLHVFIRTGNYTERQRQSLTHGAKQLGAAFQNINFLRDLGNDVEHLNRNYLSDEGALTEDERRRLLRQITTELDDAALTIPLLPADCRAAVSAAHGLFAALLHQLSATTTQQLYSQRMRISNYRKAGIIAKVLAQSATLRTKEKICPGQS